MRDLKESLLEHALSLPIGDRATLLRVASLCSDPYASAAGIAVEASRDEALSALLLKIANSAWSGSRTPVSDLTAAVVRLGTSLVQGIALAAPGLRLLDGPQDELQPARRELHRHAVRVGVVARALAPDDPTGEQALAAGLVHNIGLNVLALASREHFRVLVGAGVLGRPLAETEESLLGFTHADLGASLAERWGYPLSLVCAIRDHELDDAVSPVTAAVRVADLLTRGRGIGVEPPDPIALVRFDPEGAAAARANPLLDALNRLEAAPGEAPEAPHVDEAALREARAALF